MNRLIITLFLIIVILFGCKQPSATPLSERLQKVWMANVVREGNSTVFTKGAATNTKPGYSQFRLDLSTSAAVRLTELDGNSFTGQWELSADEKTLTLKNLSPQPTQTAGVIVYTIASASDAALSLTRTTTNLKTGGTLNSYELTQ